jgi:photosystem II stability/assembly factor-like uncharacterized protein
MKMELNLARDQRKKSAGALRKLVKLGLSLIPWLIIAALLWAGLFLKPKPLGASIQPASIERTDFFYGIAAPAEGVLWIVGNNGKIVRSEDNGQSWTLQKSPTKQHLQDIAVWDAKRAVAVGNGGVVIVTADGGATWIPASAPLSQVSNKLLRVKALPNGHAWAVGEMGAILESVDYGHNWQRRRDEEDAAWNDVRFIDASTGWIVGEAGRMMRTSDAGKSWKQVPSPVKSSLMAIAFRDAANGVAVGLEGSLLATHDGGNTWALLPRAKRPVRSLSAEEPGKIASPSADSPTMEEAREHLFDVAWDEVHQTWIAVGDQGVWARGSKDADAWQAGRIDPRNMAWHTAVTISEGHVYLAGANVGEWNQQNNTWRAFAGNKGKIE